MNQIFLSQCATGLTWDRFIIHIIDVSYTYEQLRTGLAAQKLRPLVSSLTNDCNHQLIVPALLLVKIRALWIFNH